MVLVPARVSANAPDMERGREGEKVREGGGDREREGGRERESTAVLVPGRVRVKTPNPTPYTLHPSR